MNSRGTGAAVNRGDQGLVCGASTVLPICRAPWRARRSLSKLQKEKVYPLMDLLKKNVRLL